MSKRLSKFEIYDTIETEKKFKIFSDFYLPISLVKITNKEIQEEQKTYTIEEAKNIGIQELQEELDNEIEDKEKIVNKIINTYEKEDGIEVYITYEVLENIGTPLINGWMEGKYTGIRYVHAKGEIEAKAWHTKRKIIPYNTTERKETGE